MSIKINKRVVMYTLLLIPFFKPVGPAIYNLYNTIFMCWKVISMAVIFIFILNKSKGKISSFESDNWMVGLFLFFASYLFNILRSDTMDVVGAISNIAVILELIYLSKEVEKNSDILRALEFIFETWLVIQILSVFYIRTGHIIFEDLGTDYTYFLGTDNYSAFATIPMLSIILFCNYKRKNIAKTFKCILLSCGLCISYIYTGAVAASTAALLLVVMCFLYTYWGGIVKLFKIKRVVIVSALMIALIMAFNIQNYMIRLLVLVGKGDKGTTLNSRTIIWELAANIVKENPIVGIGELSTMAVNNYALYGMGHAHNLFLDLMLKSGLLGMVSYLYFYIGVISKYRRAIMKSENGILLIALIVYFVLSMFDDYIFVPYIYCCIGLLWGCARKHESKFN